MLTVFHVKAHVKIEERKTRLFFSVEETFQSFRFPASGNSYVVGLGGTERRQFDWKCSVLKKKRLETKKVGKIRTATKRGR